MPTYEYECICCESRFDLRQSFSDNTTVRCPKCEGETRRIFSPVPIIFNGPGFYTTDSRNNYNPPSAEGGTNEAETGSAEKKGGTNEAKTGSTEKDS